VALGALALLGVAAALQPNPRGLGTHEQLGLRACGFHERTGYPCPTCGMTTAFAYAARGRLVEAFVVQPAGALLALGCLVVAVFGGYAAGGGQAATHWLMRLSLAKLILVPAGVIMASWLWLCWLTALRHGGN